MGRRIFAFIGRARRSRVGLIALAVILGMSMGGVILLQELGPELFRAAYDNGQPLPLRKIVGVMPLFFLGGIFLAASALLDVRSGIPKSDWPFTRVTVGAASLAAFFSYGQWGLYGELIWPWIAGAAAVGAVMAWFGWRWARIIEHI